MINIEDMKKAKHEYAMSQRYGAHFLPYSWLYDSTVYRVFAIVIPVISLMLAITGMPQFIPALMVISDVIMIILFLNKSNKKK